MKKEEIDNEEEEKKNHRKRNWIIFIAGIILAFTLSTFLTAISFGYAPDYLTKIVCKEQPVTVLEYYDEKEPYSTKKYYTEREPYTTCAGYSFWTGKCNEWKTAYRDVQKSREVTKYKTVKKSREVTQFKELCVRIYIWKSVDFSENWIYYPELYNRQGERIEGK